ncbi:MAG: site-specific DNA-methyltransferase [Thermoanaerobaculia bacterium]
MEQSVPTLDLVLETRFGSLFHGDCVTFLQSLQSSSVDLLFADPPFNLGKDYGKGVSDSLASDRYLAWCRSWLEESVRALKEGGACFVFNLPKWNLELGHHLRELGMEFRHWIAIDIKYSLPIPGRLYPSHYSLIYFTKGKPRTFSRPRIPIPTCRHCGGDIKDYGGHRKKLHPDGLNLADVWTDIPPVRHASTKRRAANELSVRLLHRVLSIASLEGDLIVDPFGGSGTTYFVAEQMKRKWLGCELGDCEPIVRRLRGEEALVARKNRGDAGKGLSGRGKKSLKLENTLPLFSAPHDHL